jgi:hypothetical protein
MRERTAANTKVWSAAVAHFVVLAVVLGGAIYEVFYGPNREINVVAAIVLAVSLFAVRKHYRTTYGAIEIAFGVFVLWNTWRQGRRGFSADFSSDFDVWNWTIILLQVFGAVYVIIRGLDNIDQGSKAGNATHPMVALLHRGCQRAISIL